MDARGVMQKLGVARGRAAEAPAVPVMKEDAPACGTRQRIIEAASQLFWERSYGGVSVDDICEKAAVKKGSFYHFFSSKADIIQAAMEHDWACFQPMMDSIFSPRRTPVERLGALVAHTLEKQAAFKREHGIVLGCPYANIGSEMGSEGAPIREKADALLKRYLAYFAALINDAKRLRQVHPDVDADAMAQQMWSSCVGLLVQARITNDLSVLERDLPVVLGRFLGGVKVVATW